MSTILTHPSPRPIPALTDRKMKESHSMFFRILCKLHFVLILHVECLSAKNNLVSFQSYVALVLFSRMRKRKLNKISLFPIFIFLHKVSSDLRICFSKQLHLWQLAGV